mmetsp:Transcript_729/g.1334  ORF Transcript_729/g.1334 Transcript_729/m.1334 type:complete len:212 (-) Transcript_729:487-1122(-)
MRGSGDSDSSLALQDCFTGDGLCSSGPGPLGPALPPSTLRRSRVGIGACCILRARAAAASSSASSGRASYFWTSSWTDGLSSDSAPSGVVGNASRMVGVAGSKLTPESGVCSRMTRLRSLLFDSTRSASSTRCSSLATTSSGMSMLPLCGSRLCSMRRTWSDGTAGPSLRDSSFASWKSSDAEVLRSSISPSLSGSNKCDSIPSKRLRCWA